MFKIPVVFIIYKRLETTVRVLNVISDIKPTKLYVIADGPKNTDEESNCLLVRDFVDNNINWRCDFVKVYSDENLGCAKRVQSGLDHVFEIEEMAIILEDDTLPDHSFFNFCEELLERYKHDNRVAHISGCNLHSDALDFEQSYCFSSIVNIWGWATWKRVWKSYEFEMPSWHLEDKTKFLAKWCVTKSHIKSVRKMFDLHCNNQDPWTWDIQWMYNCWRRSGLSIIPSRNLVSNIGVGPDATNTVANQKIEKYPKITERISFPLVHSKVERNLKFDYKYINKCKRSYSRYLIILIKNILNFFKLNND